MAKDTIIPVKFEKELTIEEIEAFINVVFDFAYKTEMKVAIISMNAVKKRVEARDTELNVSNRSELLMACLNKLEELGYNIDFEYDKQTCDEVIKAIAGENILLDLNGKTIPTTFHISKFEPKINIDLNNDC